MKATASQRILVVAAGCLLAVATAGAAAAAPLTLQPAADEPAAPAIASGDGSFDALAHGDVGFSVSQGSSQVFFKLLPLVACDLLGSSSPFICGYH
ncbi:hypothetical protein AB0L82_42390 [Nocardia sp. NPDC052001]|uniref:hypothetical protein n=1 Tax=Nocardia sp. NPDC052001 TaxID=3154853 RepID=UPI00344A89F7